MTAIRAQSPAFDPDAVRAKYREERAKRMVAGRADIRDLTGDGPFSTYRRDPFTPFADREARGEDVDIAIVGAGIAGVVAGARLREAGLDRIRLIDWAGGIGGTWYWNRYPGVMCDVESYVYMPMLEEMDYVPSMRYAFGDEIRKHLDAIARRYDLIDDALFHTGVEESRWDEGAARWRLRTDRGDEIMARYLLIAVGILNLMKMPVIPGMELFEGRSFHSARWDYAYTGGGPDGQLDKLADKVVGIIGTGASAIQCVPHLAQSAKHLYLFQRTPSAIGVRDNRATEAEFNQHVHGGWQQERMDNFTAVMIGRDVDRDLTDDGWTHHMAAVSNPPSNPEMSREERRRRVEEIDFAIMEAHRSRVDESVSDRQVAEILKPYYRYLCKRPCFHDEYLDAFNRPNVTLVDCPAGIERVTPKGVVVKGTEVELDCLIYATGFEAESTPLPRRAGHPIIGRDGVSLADKWKDGVISLHGVATRGFPNLFLMPGPRQQAVATVNYTHVCVEGAKHIGATVAMLEQRGITRFEVTSEAEARWGETLLSSYVDNSAFLSACTPSRFNFEGNPNAANPRNSNYGGGVGDMFAYRALLDEWRARGDLEGWELKEGS